jgi:hypothetical protein
MKLKIFFFLFCNIFVQSIETELKIPSSLLRALKIKSTYIYLVIHQVN